MQLDMKWDKQRSKAVNIANRILGMIKIFLCCLNEEVVSKLYTSLVKPHLEYGMQA
jgi:hypothetical protein